MEDPRGSVDAPQLDPPSDSAKRIRSRADSAPRYGIGDVAATTGISAFTIRYYDKCGFFPNLARDRRGVRKFSDADIAQLNLVEALRKSGLSIEGIQYYVRLSKRGSSARAERLAILRAQETVLEYQREELDESLKRLRAATVDLAAEEDSVHFGMV